MVMLGLPRLVSPHLPLADDIFQKEQDKGWQQEQRKALLINLDFSALENVGLRPGSYPVEVENLQIQIGGHRPHIGSPGKSSNSSEALLSKSGNNKLSPFILLEPARSIGDWYRPAPWFPHPQGKYFHSLCCSLSSRLLGLFLAQSTIKRLGGSVELFNRQQGGACARIILPLPGLIMNP